MKAIATVAAILLSAPALGGAISPPASAPPPEARFGYIAPTAKELLTQPVLDRYANDIQQRLAAADTIPIVPVPKVRGENVAGADVCKLLQLSGFVEPHLHWQVTAHAVTVDAVLVITDCDGNMFYEGDAAHTQRREGSVLPQTQLDAVQSLAASDLVHKFGAYKQAHESDWEQLARTGSLVTPQP